MTGTVEHPIVAHYLIAFLGPAAAARRATLESTLAQRLEILGEQVASGVAFVDGSQLASRNPATPIAAVYFGDDNTATASDIAVIRELRASAVVIVPVVNDLGRYAAQTPPELHPVNGYALPSDDRDLDVNTGHVVPGKRG